MLEITHCSLSDISAMLSYNPARSVHLADRKGSLQVGHDADLVIYDRSLQLQATICRGELAYASEEWRSHIG